MPPKVLHIISFDNPYPPVYGGTIEVFSKLKPLHALGVEIHLHCFAATVPVSSETEKYCAAVHYYKYSKNPIDLFSWLPFSVQARNDARLRKNIAAVDAPVFFEGLKTTYGMYKNWFDGHRTILRMHNIEHSYFEGIAASEKRFWLKWAYALEAYKYKKYEKIIARFDRVVALSRYEDDYINRHFGHSEYVPVFHGNEKVSDVNGMGKYALYHGDMRMSDNRRVAENLIAVFRSVPDVELVIAARKSTENHFIKRIGTQANVRYVALKDFGHLKELLHGAHINLVFSYQKSGTKLKLMNALYYSRFCIINANIMDDEQIQPLCETADTNEAIIAQVNRLKHQPFAGYEQRKQVLESHMNDYKNAQKLLELIAE